MKSLMIIGAAAWMALAGGCVHQDLREIEKTEPTRIYYTSEPPAAAISAIAQSADATDLSVEYIDQNLHKAVISGRHFMTNERVVGVVVRADLDGTRTAVRFWAKAFLRGKSPEFLNKIWESYRADALARGVRDVSPVEE